MADLAAYGTDDAVEDLEVARVAFGSRQLDLVGGSYGTRLAMEYMERFLALARAIAAPAPSQPQQTPPSDAAPPKLP